MRKLFLLPLLLLPLAGCATWHKMQGSGETGANTPLSAAQTASAPDFYLPPTQVDLTLLLPPPPAAGSPEEKRDIDAVLAAQKSRTPVIAKKVIDDAKSTIYRFADVLGPSFAEDKLPITTAFFQKLQKNLSAYADITKECYARPRPFVADKKVHPPGTLGESTRNNPEREKTARALLPADAATRCAKFDGSPHYSYSYPSGHSTFGAMTAIILAQMVPEKRTELFKRGWAFGDARVTAGVHYPSDVTAGRIQAAVVVGFMEQSPAFQKDFAAARTELRAALALGPGS